MATLYGQKVTLINAGTTIDPGFVDGTLRCFVEEVTLASQATTDTIVVAKLPKGAVPLYGVVSTSVSLGTATIAIGITGTTGKYRAAATLTAVTPEVFGANGGLGTALTADEDVFITIGTAALPASGTLRVMFFYTFD